MGNRPRRRLALRPSRGHSNEGSQHCGFSYPRLPRLAHAACRSSDRPLLTALIGAHGRHAGLWSGSSSTWTPLPSTPALEYLDRLRRAGRETLEPAPPLESTSEILGSIFCSQAKEYLGPYGRVTNTWKAKIRSRIQLLPDLDVPDHPRLTLDFLIPATTLSFRWLVQRPGTCSLEPCTTRAAV
jgi:hypothetical protein